MNDIVCPNCNSRAVLRSLEWWSDSPYKFECLDCKYVWYPQPEPAEVETGAQHEER